MFAIPACLKQSAAAYTFHAATVQNGAEQNRKLMKEFYLMRLVQVNAMF